MRAFWYQIYVFPFSGRRCWSQLWLSFLSLESSCFFFTEDTNSQVSVLHIVLPVLFLFQMFHVCKCQHVQIHCLCPDCYSIRSLYNIITRSVFQREHKQFHTSACIWWVRFKLVLVSVVWWWGRWDHFEISDRVIWSESFYNVGPVHQFC